MAAMPPRDLEVAWLSPAKSRLSLLHLHSAKGKRFSDTVLPTIGSSQMAGIPTSGHNRHVKCEERE